MGWTTYIHFGHIFTNSSGRPARIATKFSLRSIKINHPKVRKECSQKKTDISKVEIPQKCFQTVCATGLFYPII
jgi:hypothetical protein